MRSNHATGLLGAGLVLAVAGCSGLLDVKNPNNVNESDLNNPASAAAQANGVLASLTRAWGNILTPYSMATDELTWIGSRDAWRNLDEGQISEPTNEFVDAAYFYVGEARWWADTTIGRLVGFKAKSVLANDDDLARSYLYGALVFTAIGNLFDNFPIGSSGRNAAPPLGASKMDSVYKTAINYATNGITLAQATSNKALELDLTAARATARYYLALWGKLNPAPASVPVASPLVNDAGAVTDANAALALATTLKQPDYRFQLTFSSATVNFADIGFEVNERLEMRIGSAYVYPLCTQSGCGSGGKTIFVDSIRLRDPIDNRPDPELARFLCGSATVATCPKPDVAGGSSGFLNTTHFTPLTVLSARELRLIVAEAALAAGNTAGFQTAIDSLRALDGLTAWTPASTVTALDLLKYERQTNLFLQGRRLSDHYRFGAPADIWQPGQEALTTPGTFLPITISERLANPACLADPASCGGR